MTRARTMAAISTTIVSRGDDGDQKGNIDYTNGC